MRLQVNPDSLPKIANPHAAMTVTLGGVAVLQLQIDPRVSPQAATDYVLAHVFNTLQTIEQRIADLETIAASLPGCARPQADALPSLFAVDDMLRDALSRVHDLVDARAATAAKGAVQHATDAG